MKVKLFSEYDVEILERKVNGWLEANPKIDILSLSTESLGEGELGIIIRYNGPEQEYYNIEMKRASELYQANIQ